MTDSKNYHCADCKREQNNPRVMTDATQADIDRVLANADALAERDAETLPDSGALSIVDLSCGQFEYNFLSAFEGWTVRVDGTDYQLVSADRWGVLTLQPWDNDRDCIADVDPIVIDLRAGNHELGIY